MYLQKIDKQTGAATFSFQTAKRSGTCCTGNSEICCSLFGWESGQMASTIGGRVVVFSALLTFLATSIAYAQIINVHVVAHTHDDVGWLKTVDQYYYGANQSIQDAGVQYILDTVVQALQDNPARKFIYVEQAFFTRWWNEQTDAKKQIVKDLVTNGQLEFINGGWCMNDEATTHYTAIIDQMTEGHDFIFNTFGVRPRIGWHIDPFGHSSAHAALFAKTGFDAFFFARMDYQDLALRNQTKGLELVWRGFKSYGQDADMFTHMIYDGYGTPDGFCFECGDPPIQDDPLLFNVNIQERAQLFAQQSMERASVFRTNNILVPFGSDFQFSNALLNFKNMDKLMAYLNANQATYKLNVFYSTPSIYIDMVNADGQSYPLKTDDFFPYADGPHSYWTGYFTSRAAIKGFVRSRTNLLHAVDQLFATIPSRQQVNFQQSLQQIQTLSQALGVAQHHDAVSGTEKQHVAYDYAERLQIGTDASNELVSSLIGTYINANGPNGAPTFVDCPYLNISQCGPTLAVTSGKAVAIAIYNPLGWNRVHTVKFPVTNAAKVFDSNGNPVPAQVTIDIDNVPNLVFEASVPALGFSTYFLEAGSSSDTTFSKPEVPEPDADTVVDSTYVTVTISGVTNRVTSIVNKVTGVSLTLDQNFQWYNASAGNNADDQASGAYIFRPNSTALFNITAMPAIAIVRGQIVQEIQQTFAPWLTQVIRLYNNSEFLHLETTVGPVPIDDGLGKEVISRYATGLNTGDYFYTDTNGLEMLQRKINYRPTWPLNVTEPISGNYYPLNTAAYIKDVAVDAQLTIVTDRSHGVGSVDNGELELMYQRRLLYDDSRGVGEALNESAPIRVFDYLAVTKASLSSRAQRTLAQFANYPLLYYFSPTDSAASWIKQYKTSFSPLVAPLPANVRLETLKTRPDGSVLLRLAHLYAVGDDAQLSQNVTVDLTSLFADRTPISVTELTLTANRPISELRRLTWNVENEQPYKPAVQDSAVNDFVINLAPMDIRTFSVRFQDSKK
eukprot:TRINITY_DN5728_c0_g2_i1.p1 TRINITY_DN5728_c0_g2~~TRINITY_DN5728_c0_g2_i1.p1  ORF type:complete len:1012 (-),score=366.51 TRINITY_DN5728_c0_g2_i1:80-3115(-)